MSCWTNNRFPILDWQVDHGMIALGGTEMVAVIAEKYVNSVAGIIVKAREMPVGTHKDNILKF